MDGMPPPDVAATEVPVDSLIGTAKSLARAAQRAGYTVRATRALGPRLPRQLVQPIVRTSSVAIIGIRDDSRFQAVKTETDAWEVLIWTDGWPVRPSSVTGLRAMLKAQTEAAS